MNKSFILALLFAGLILTAHSVAARNLLDNDDGDNDDGYGNPACNTAYQECKTKCNGDVGLFTCNSQTGEVTTPCGCDTNDDDGSD